MKKSDHEEKWSRWRRKWRGRSLEGEEEEKEKWGMKRERDGKERGKK